MATAEVVVQVVSAAVLDLVEVVEAVSGGCSLYLPGSHYSHPNGTCSICTSPHICKELLALVCGPGNHALNHKAGSLPYCIAIRCTSRHTRGLKRTA